jgi:hypothetical protein
MLQMSFNKDDLQDFDRRLAGMLQKLDHFGTVDLGREMSDWQVQDMHRHRPFTMRWRGRVRKVMTKVRPHSLREVLGQRRYMRKVLKLKVGRAPRRHRTYHRWSTRPILRGELLGRLQTHMQLALATLIKW